MRVAVLGGGRSSEHESRSQSARVGPRRAWRRRGHEPVAVADRARRALDRTTASAVALEPSGGLLGADACSPRCTGRSARTARSRGCSSCSTCPTWARACWRRRSAWTRSLFKDLMARAGVPQVAYAAAREGDAAPPGGVGPPVFVKPARLGRRWASRRRSARSSSTRRSSCAFAHDPLRDRRGASRRHGGRVLGARQRRPAGLHAGRDRREGRRLVRLRGEVHRRRDGAGGARAHRRRGGGVRALAVEVFKLVGCAGMARVDFFVRGRRARQRAEHDPRLHRDERVREALGGERVPYPSCWTACSSWRWNGTQRERRYRL